MEQEGLGRIYVGIDPGVRGYIAARLSDGGYMFLPLRDASYASIATFLSGLKKMGVVVCCMEAVHAVHSSSASSTFEFGRINGVLEGIMCAVGVAYSMVSPKRWQGMMWDVCDKEMSVRGGVRRVDPKRTSLNAARRLFPGVDLRRTLKCQKDDDNKCDALLLCEYARRNNL